MEVCFLKVKLVGATIGHAIYSQSIRLSHTAWQAYNFLGTNLGTTAATILTAFGTSPENLWWDSKPRQSFSQFQNLPPEIRCSIWALALPGLRTIELRTVHGSRVQVINGCTCIEPAVMTPKVPTSICQIPSLLRVNREARSEALKVYSLSLGIGDSPPRTFIDFSIDTVYFGSKSDFYYYGTRRPRHECVGTILGNELPGREKIQHLAVNTSLCNDFKNWDLGAFESLKEIVLLRTRWSSRTRGFELGTTPTLQVQRDKKYRYDDPWWCVTRQEHEEHGRLREILKESGRVVEVWHGWFLEGPGDRFFSKKGLGWNF